MTEFENNVRMLRHWQREHASRQSCLTKDRKEYYEKLVDNYLEEILSPSINFDFSV